VDTAAPHIEPADVVVLARALGVREVARRLGKSASYVSRLLRKPPHELDVEVVAELARIAEGPPAHSASVDWHDHFESAWLLQREQLTVEAASLSVFLTVEPSGAALLTRHWAAARPLRDKAKIEFRERILAAQCAVIPTIASYAVVSDNPAILFEHHTADGPGGWRWHEIEPKGGTWPAAGVGCLVSGAVPGLLVRQDPASEPAFQRFSYIPRQHLTDFTISMSFPVGYHSPEWTFRAAFPGAAEIVEEDLADRGSCESWHLDAPPGSQARVTIRKPLAGYAFMLMWRPDPAWAKKET